MAWALLSGHEDAFTAADATNLDGRTMTGGTGVWTKVGGTWEVHSNHGRETSGVSDRYLYDSAASAVDKQRVEMVAVSNLDIGPMCRFGTTGGVDGYLMYLLFTNGNVILYRIDNGALTNIASGGNAQAGDTVMIEADGSTITCYVNGVSVCNASDSTYATGVGAVYSGGLGSQEFDDWKFYVDAGGGVFTPYYYQEHIARTEQ